MRKRTLTIIATALLLTIPLSASDLPAYIPSISVSGTAEISMQPDTAFFSVTSSFTEPTTEEARTKTTEMINETVSILTTEFGVSTEDIETSYISAYPEYQWKDDERILIGQRVSQSIEVKLHDIDAIGDVYTRLMSIDGISLSDVTLDKEDKSEEYREARMEAVHDAYEKASAFAEAAGVKVGSVISISDNSSYASPIYRSANMMLAAADSTAKVSAPTEFYSQEITVSATVSVVYGIDQ